ncbi:MAG: Cell cycle response regulator CtrA [Candidatus Omnitrophica bacterium ADurb.Bin292]|nr:MAG: Cell cycle response regulator CtrA [Candidatus Omnitrophica bacterium ADurb.Bin292]HQB12264.1 response regulator [Candidatus Omnitrophota bacterium]
MLNRAIKVLVIEDDANYFIFLSEMLAYYRSPSFEVSRARMLQSGLDRLRTGDVELVLLDLTLPDSSGLNTLITVRKSSSLVPVVILTGVDDPALSAQAIGLGAQDYIVKGSFDREQLRSRMLNAIDVFYEMRGADEE